MFLKKTGDQEIFISPTNIKLVVHSIKAVKLSKRLLEVALASACLSLTPKVIEPLKMVFEETPV